MFDANFVTKISATFFANRHEWIVVSHTLGGNRVVKHPEHDIVVKYGRGVIREEAEAQRHALTILDPAIVYVPQVYGFFYDDKGQIGHLIMEKVDGLPVEGDCHTHITAIGAAVNHLQSLSRAFPGPLHSGEPQGVLWENGSPVTNNKVQDLEAWINMWQDESISLQGEKFVLCHLDTALKNMLYMHSGQICLLDWASAGYFPRYFEVAAHLKKGNPDQAVEKLLRSPCIPFSPLEEEHLRVLMRACANSMRYACPRPATREPGPTRHYLSTQPAMPEMTKQPSSVNATPKAISIGRE